MVWTTNLVHRERRQGTQQHPHTTNIAVNMATVIINDRIIANILIMLDHIEVSTPECSLNSSDMILNLDDAFVKEPSGAVLLAVTACGDIEWVG